MFCANCGKEIENKNDFCTNCGMKLKKDNTKKEKDKKILLIKNWKIFFIVFAVCILILVVFGIYKENKNMVLNNEYGNVVESENISVKEKKYMSVQDVYNDFKKQNLEMDVSFIEVRKYPEDLIILVYRTIPNSGYGDEIGFITVQENSYIFSEKELWEEWDKGEEKVREAINIKEYERVSKIWNNEELSYEKLSNIETSLYVNNFKYNERVIENIKRQSNNDIFEKTFSYFGNLETSQENLGSTSTVTNNQNTSYIKTNSNDKSNLENNKSKPPDQIDNSNSIQELPKKSERELAKEQMELIQIRIIPKGDENTGYEFFNQGQISDLSFVVNLIHTQKEMSNNPDSYVSFNISFYELIEEFFNEEVNTGISKHYMCEFEYKIQITNSTTGENKSVTPYSHIDQAFSDNFKVIDGNNTFTITITDKYNNSKVISNTLTI